MAGGLRIAALVIVLAALAIVGLTGTLSGTPAPSDQRSAPAAGAPGPASLPTVNRSELPPEARATLERIAAGGPFPYAADGATFENRERLLPLRPTGTYREYTVATPGSTDRGARRIVAASSGERYWTADHYASFARIVP